MNMLLSHFSRIGGAALWICWASALGASEPPMVVEEHFATLTVQDETYTNVTITKVSKTDVFFQHAHGMGNVKLKNLSPELQAHFTAAPASIEAKKTATQAPATKTAGAPGEGLDVGKKFPGFSVKDLSGQPLSVAGLRGKVVLIDFWATWCGPCRQSLPDVQAAYQKFHNQGFEVIGISLDNDRKALDQFVHQKGLPWPQYFDGGGWGNKLARQYGVNSIPATFLLNQQGVIIAKNLHGDELKKAVGQALAKP